MPEDFKPERRLAAIVFTDIVGFTKLTAADQTKAAALLVKQRELLKPMVESMNGKWVKEMGDGLLLIFDTVTDAVECCIEIQKILKPIKHLNLRIGIHEGEILITENDVIGDDVNIAARIEPFSAEGGIAISNKVNDAIVREEIFETKYLGKPKLKGVGQTVEVYCITSHDLPETNLSKVSAKLERKTPIWMIIVPLLLVIGIAGYFIMPKKPKVVSVAVMYMEIIGNKEDQFLETITEDIIFNLSKALPGNLMVSEVSAVRKLKNTDLEVADIAKSLGVQYVFESSLQRSGDGFNLGCKLVEAKTGSEKFLNKWFIGANSLPSIVGVLVENIIGGLDIPMAAELRKIEYNSESYELYLKAIDLYARSDNIDQDLEAINKMKEAIDLDDKLIAAQLKLGIMYYDNGNYTDADFLYERSLKRSRQLEDNSNIAESLRKQGMLFRKQRQYDEALEKFNEALSIFKVMNDKSSMAKVMNSIAILYYKTKRLDEALVSWLQAYNTAKEFDDKLKISKYVNNIGIWYWRDYDYSKAIDYYNESLLIKKELGDTRNYGKTLNNMGQVYYDMGDFSSSIAYFNQSIELKEKLNDKKGLQSTLLNMGKACFGNEDYEEALGHFRKSLTIATSFDIIYEISDRYTAIGMTHFNLTNYDSAAYYLTMADDIFSENPVGRLTILSWLAVTSIKDGKTQRAKVYVKEFEEIISTVDPLDEEIISLNWNMYRVQQLLGNTKTAKEYLENSYLEIKSRSKNIKDKKDRGKYLSVKLNQDIAAAWNN